MLLRLVRATVLAALLSTAAAAAHAVSRPLIAGDESAAFPDGPASLILNPAAYGLRYPAELALTMLDARAGKDLFRGTIATRGLALSAAGAERDRLTLSAGLAGGRDLLRFGAAVDRLPEKSGGTLADHRLGLLSRPAPWLSLGGVVAHAGRPRLDGARLERAYTLGVGLRPLALSRVRAHSWGPRLSVSADALLAEDQKPRDATFRLGAELEPLPGLALRGSYFTADRRFQLGASLLGVRSAYHAQSAYDRRQTPRSLTHSLSFHAAEDLTLHERSNRRVAAIRIGGPLGDDALNGFSIFGAVSTTPIEPIRLELDRALEDHATRGVLIELGGAANMAQLEELRPRIARLRQAGKPVVAYLEAGGGRGDIYLAAACDRIVVSPEAYFAGLGLRAERRYYRGLLADWGVRIDRTSYGKYKSAFRNFSVDSTSDADREVIEHTLDQVQEMFVAAVTADRHLSRERLLAILDGRRYTPEDLEAAGLIDSVGYREDALEILGGLAGLGRHPRTARLARAPLARRDWTLPTGIAVVYAAGGIESGRSGNDLLLGPVMGAETLRRQIESAFRRRDVKAVVLRVESPGGSSLASDLIHHTLDRMKRETKKPLVVSMGGVAASGGYHISVPADRIYADRFTRTGSIGVLFVRPSLEGWYRKHGVREDDFERGRYMRGWSEARDWDEEMQSLADSSIHREYLGFVATVARGRKLSTEHVDQVAQGRVWLGDDALERKLVDEIGGLDQALAEARRRAGIPAGEKLRIAEYRRPAPGLVQHLVGSIVSEAWERSMRTPDPGEPLYWMDEAP